MLNNMSYCLHVVWTQQEGENVYFPSYIIISHVDNLRQIFALILKIWPKHMPFEKGLFCQLSPSHIQSTVSDTEGENMVFTSSVFQN